ncbi:desmin-like [Conger conger]|uniref:desmin-like n=1 Tax=Conger conger TaxID=82655 RepID=UPI002A5A826F|nr:desmin-like [Conger conger]
MSTTKPKGGSVDGSLLHRHPAAMLRVSLYRRLFEEEPWASQPSGGRYLSSARGRTTEFQWEEPDFKAARALNREGMSQFKKERVMIAELNDRLALLFEMARCLEEDNVSLEAQILELEEKLSKQETAISIGLPECGLELVVERLRREKEQILCDVAMLKGELDLLQVQHAEAVEQRSLICLEREDVALDVDVVTAECLALKEQAGIYEDQLAMMRVEYESRVENMAEPAMAVPVVTLEFSSPDVTPAILDIEEYFCQLAKSLQFKSKVVAGIAVGEQDEGTKAKLSGARMADMSKVDELKTKIAELQKELAELERYGEELDDTILQRRAAYLEEVEELEDCLAELEAAQAQLGAQMKDQCGDYQDLLTEKMTRDMEIAYYRGLVEVEEERLHYL